jgi:hypothetical protein
MQVANRKWRECDCDSRVARTGGSFDWFTKESKGQDRDAEARDQLKQADRQNDDADCQAPQR